jgi:hypothetical protein
MFVVLAIFLLGGVGGMAAAMVASSDPVALGGNGAALAMIVAWAIPDLIALRRREEIDGDLIGTVAIAAVVALMPLAVTQASWVADGVGVLVGVVVGWPLALLDDR